MVGFLIFLGRIRVFVGIQLARHKNFGFSCQGFIAFVGGDPIAADEMDSSPVVDAPTSPASPVAGDERHVRSLEGWGGSGLKLVREAFLDAV